jgi:hypothetical protein
MALLLKILPSIRVLSLRLHHRLHPFCLIRIEPSLNGRVSHHSAKTIARPRACHGLLPSPAKRLPSQKAAPVPRPDGLVRQGHW